MQLSNRTRAVLENMAAVALFVLLGVIMGWPG
jgi:hypothetical protein